MVPADSVTLFLRAAVLYYQKREQRLVILSASYIHHRELEVWMHCGLMPVYTSNVRCPQLEQIQRT